MQRVKVTHIGSTRFYRVFDLMNTKDTMDGKIVLTIGCVIHSDNDLFAALLSEERRQKKEELDQLHLCKIDESDEVLVINVGGYLRNSTLHELCYSYNHQKSLRWLEDYIMFCPKCKIAGLERDHFFHAALTLDELDDILDSDEAAINHLFGEAPGYDAMRIADWHGEMAPIVRLENGTIALQLDLTCSRCRQNHETQYVISGCHHGAFCYLIDKAGEIVADLRNQEFVCDECHHSKQPAASYSTIFRRWSLYHTNVVQQEMGRIVPVRDLPTAVQPLAVTIASSQFKRLILTSGDTELIVTTCDEAEQQDIRFHTIGFDSSEVMSQFIKEVRFTYGMTAIDLDFDHSYCEARFQTTTPLTELQRSLIVLREHVIFTQFNRLRQCCACHNEIEQEEACTCMCHDEHEENPARLEPNRPLDGTPARFYY